MSSDAFTAVYREHVRFVWRLSRSLGVQPMHVDDVVHEIFLVVRRRLPPLDPDTPLRAWLARITRNVVMRYHRGEARRARRIAAVEPPTAARSLDDEVGLREAAASMQAFLDGLPVGPREVFVMMEIEGLTAPECAAATNANVSTVYTRLRKARSELERFIEKLHGDDGIVNGSMEGKHRGE